MNMLLLTRKEMLFRAFVRQRYEIRHLSSRLVLRFLRTTPMALIHEAELDRRIDVRVELPGQPEKRMDVWLMNPNSESWLVSQEKERLLSGLNSTLYHMVIKTDTFEAYHAEETKVTMVETDEMAAYIDKLSTGILSFELA